MRLSANGWKAENASFECDVESRVAAGVHLIKLELLIKGIDRGANLVLFRLIEDIQRCFVVKLREVELRQTV